MRWGTAKYCPVSCVELLFGLPTVQTLSLNLCKQATKCGFPFDNLIYWWIFIVEEQIGIKSRGFSLWFCSLSFYSLRLILRSIYTFASALEQTPSTPCAHACGSSLIRLALWHYITLHDHPSLRCLRGSQQGAGTCFTLIQDDASATTFPTPTSILLWPALVLTKQVQNPEMCVHVLTHRSLGNLLLACRNTSLPYLKHLSECCYFSTLPAVFKLFGNICYLLDEIFAQPPKVPARRLVLSLPLSPALSPCLNRRQSYILARVCPQLAAPRHNRCSLVCRVCSADVITSRKGLG